MKIRIVVAKALTTQNFTPFTPLKNAKTAMGAKPEAETQEELGATTERVGVASERVGVAFERLSTSPNMQ